MHRLRQLDSSRDLWVSSSSSSASSTSNNDDSQDQSVVVTTITSLQPLPFPSTHFMNNRRSLLPAYPSFERQNGNNQENHLLRANAPRKYRS
jgi:hypothetical protein